LNKTGNTVVKAAPTLSEVNVKDTFTSHIDKNIFLTKFSVWEQVPVTRLGTRGSNTLHHQSIIIHHTCTFLFI
jgi:hypothetical protein